MAQDDWKRERDERLARLWLRPRADDRGPGCVYCGGPLRGDGSAHEDAGLCDDCLHRD